MCMRRRRYRRNAPSSKAAIVESLLRLGDIARNNQIGEVTTALDKAKLLIDKYGLTSLLPTYHRLVEKVAAFHRGERVERDDTAQSSQQRQQYQDHRKEQRRRQKEDRYRQWYEHQRQRTAGRAHAKASRATKEKAPYTRPKKSAQIEWLWTKTWSPKRGKAGERWKAYVGAATVEELLARGGRWSDVKWNVQHHLMKLHTGGE